MLARHLPALDSAYYLEEKSVTAAGWYDDPDSPGVLRWWDGDNWSDHRAPKPSTPTMEEPAARRGEGAVVISIVLGSAAFMTWTVSILGAFLLGIAGLILSFYGLRFTHGLRYPIARWVGLGVPTLALVGLLTQAIVRSIILR
jgi:hypothetical protein